MSAKIKKSLKYLFSTILSLWLSFSFQLTVAQQLLWEGSEFIETPDEVYEVQLILPNADIETIARDLQPRNKKYRLAENEVVINMSFVVYEAAAIGERPYGRIRYKILLQQRENKLSCIFKDFTFKKIERNARYAKLEEVGGRPIAISTAKSRLSEDQWSIVRWKTEFVLERKLATLSSHNLQAVEMQ